MTKRARAVSLAFLIALPAVTPVLAATAPQAPAGVVGLCVRWGVDPSRIADAVIVDSSGDARVDDMASAAVRSAPIPRPADDTGGWRAMSMGFGGVEPPTSPPDCDSLRDVSGEPAAASPAPQPDGLIVA